MDKTIDARMQSNIAKAHYSSIESDIDKYETNQGFGDIVKQQNMAANAIKVKQFMP